MRGGREESGCIVGERGVESIAGPIFEGGAVELLGSFGFFFPAHFVCGDGVNLSGSLPSCQSWHLNQVRGSVLLVVSSRPLVSGLL